MNLTKYLKEQGYDLIGGPIRNHKNLQLWLKKIFNEIELYYGDINHAFKSEVALNEIENSALAISSKNTNDYNFNIGITVLDEILKSLGMVNLELSNEIKSGKSVTISYDNSITKEIPVGEIGDYFSNADFLHPNPDLLRNANRNNIIIISGIVYAKNLLVEIETNYNLNTNLTANFAQVVDGKIDFSIKSDTTLVMKSTTDMLFPIAVKADRLSFQKGIFKGMNLVSDNRDFF